MTDDTPYQPDPIVVVTISGEPCPEDETTRCIAEAWGPFPDRGAAGQFGETLPDGFLPHYIHLQDPETDRWWNRHD